MFSTSFRNLSEGKSHRLMTTKTLKRLKNRAENKPAALAQKLRKKALWVVLFFLIPAITVGVMIPLGIWVPGLAWLE